MPIKPSIDVQLALLGKSPFLFARKLAELAGSILRRDSEEERQKTESLAQLIGETMMLADLVGRRRAYVEFDAMATREQPSRFSAIKDLEFARISFGATPIFPRTTFTEAIDELLDLEPRLAKTAEEIRQIYSTRSGFAVLKLPDFLAQDARFNVTRRIQQAISFLIQEGKPIPKAAEELQEMMDWTQAYAQTVYRTNLATAYTAGRLRQAFDPDIREVIGAFEYDAVMDADTRGNHAALNGLTAAQDDPLWDLYAPPNGFNCRCDLRLVDRFELQDRGLIRFGRVTPSYPSNFSAGGPDPGFKKTGRTDRRVYG